MLVLLPGATDRPQDLINHGLVQTIRERRLPIDATVVDAHVGYYLDNNLVEHLRDEIIAPARAHGYAKIWLLGISLGGLGSMSYARAFPADVQGVILLAPFLGTRGLIAEVLRAGGLDVWHPGEMKPQDHERMLLAWLKSYRVGDPAFPEFHLGYGKADRFAPASTMLAQRIPDARVLAIEGGHDWHTWTKLWNLLLDRELFASRAKKLPSHCISAAT